MTDKINLVQYKVYNNLRASLEENSAPKWLSGWPWGSSWTTQLFLLSIIHRYPIKQYYCLAGQYYNMHSPVLDKTTDILSLPETCIESFSLWKLASRSFLISPWFISLCPGMKVCGVIRNIVIPSSYGEQSRTTAIAYVVLDDSSSGLTNNSWGDNLCLVLRFSFNSLCLLLGALFSNPYWFNIFWLWA